MKTRTPVRWQPRARLAIPILGCMVAFTALSLSFGDPLLRPPDGRSATRVGPPAARQAIPEIFKYAVVSFSRVRLHHHSFLAGDGFLIDGAIFGNDSVSVSSGLTIRDTIVSAGVVSIDDEVAVERGVFANTVENDGAIQGPVKRLAAVSDLPQEARSWDVVDQFGNKHRWYEESSAPGTYSGAGTSVEEPMASGIQDGESFTYSIFAPDGTPVDDPDLNVVHYLAPPKLDYIGMRVEADRNDDTYFTSQAQAISYLISRKVDETIEGKDVTTIRVGTADAPEFLYIDDDFELRLDRGGLDDVLRGVIAADALHIEGGVYVSGDFRVDPPRVPTATYPDDYPALRINALPYCYPALIAYPQPCGIGCRFDRNWQSRDTPAMSGTKSHVRLQAGYEGPAEIASFNGLIYADGEVHMHATEGPWIRVNGAILSNNSQLCDWFQLQHDPEVACTMFIEPTTTNRVTGPRVNR